MALDRVPLRQRAGKRISNGEDERTARQMNRIGSDDSLVGAPLPKDPPAPKPGTVHACSYDNVLDSIRQTFAEPHAVTMELVAKKGLQELEDLAQLADELSTYGSFKFNLADSAEKAMQTLQEGRKGPEPGREPQPAPEPIRKPQQASEQSLPGLQA